MTPESDLRPAFSPDAPPEQLPAVSTQPPQTRSQAGRAGQEIIETLLLAALIFFLVRLVVLNFRVDGGSMLPNLDNEQMLLVNRDASQRVHLNGHRYYPF